MEKQTLGKTRLGHTDVEGHEPCLICGKPVKVAPPRSFVMGHPFTITADKGSRSGNVNNDGKSFSFLMCDECHSDLVARARIKEQEMLMVSGSMPLVEGT